jgi:hypothetical protein
LKETNASLIDCSEDSKSFEMDDCPEQACFGSVLGKGNEWILNKGGLREEKCKHNTIDHMTSSFVVYEMDTGVDGDDEAVEHNKSCFFKLDRLV